MGKHLSLAITVSFEGKVGRGDIANKSQFDREE